MRNERGLTLIELLATIVIFAILAISITIITIQSLENNKKIKQDVELRNQAELILASAIKGIYTTLESDIEAVEENKLKIKVKQKEVSPNAQSDLVACVGTDCTVITGFVKKGEVTGFYVESVPISITPTIKISPLSTLVSTQINTSEDETASGVPTYKIMLGLYDDTSEHGKLKWFENEITSINNK